MLRYTINVCWYSQRLFIHILSKSHNISYRSRFSLPLLFILFISTKRGVCPIRFIVFIVSAYPSTNKLLYIFTLQWIVFVFKIWSNRQEIQKLYSAARIFVTILTRVFFRYVTSILNWSLNNLLNSLTFRSIQLYATIIFKSLLTYRVELFRMTNPISDCDVFKPG